jgi:hypothetical protein
MSTTREQVLSALFARLDSALNAKVVRNEVLPERVPENGLVILRDGDPGEPEAILSPLRWSYQHRIDLDVVVQRPTPPERDAAFDALIAAIGASVAADRSLDGLVERLDALAPVPTELAIEGALGLKAATLSILASYLTSDPLS